MIVGIDLGTTNSLVAHLTAEGPQIIPNVFGERLTPSVAGIDSTGQILVGKSAVELQVAQPISCARVFKRQMGTDWSVELVNGNEKRRFTAVELSALVLQSLKGDAEAWLGCDVNEAVVTVPAYFNEFQRQATMQAGEIAGLNIRRIINEPTAAAIAYGLHDREQEKVALVFDLGGGTFDVSIVDQFDGTLEVRASAGETFLGGEDFTTAVAAQIAKLQNKDLQVLESESSEFAARLRAECESAKRALTRQDTAVVRLPDDQGQIVPSSEHLTVTRAQFDLWTQEILAQVNQPIRRTLGDSQLTRDDIDNVILVGGATRMPSVVRHVAELFNTDPLCSLNPDEVVALGAAIQAGLVSQDKSLSDIVVTDIAPFTLGVEIVRSMGGRDRPGYFMPVINRNSTIPISRIERVGTVRANQTRLDIRLFQGEGRRIEENTLLGKFQVRGIPRGPAGQPVDIRFTYDLNGILEVEATIVQTGKVVTHIVREFTQGLTRQEVAEAVEAMAKIKSHPRERAENQFLLRRAERLYAELPSEQQTQLDSLLSAFEQTLEKQDPAEIESHRAPLEEFLVSLNLSSELNDV